MADDNHAKWEAKPTNLKYRIFAAGSNPANVSGISGTATYRGESHGIMQWHEDNARRISTFEGAPTTFQADFNSMTINGDISLDPNTSSHYYHNPDGAEHSTPDLAEWLRRGPGSIHFRDGDITSDGAFSNAFVSVGFNSSRTAEVPSGGNSCNNGCTLNPGAAPNQSNSELQGRFYQPDGSNAPGSALGVFRVSSEGGTIPTTSSIYYDVRGAFGAQRE